MARRRSTKKEEGASLSPEVMVAVDTKDVATLEARPTLGLYMLDKDVPAVIKGSGLAACFDICANLKDGDVIEGVDYNNKPITRVAKKYSNGKVSLTINHGDRLLIPTGYSMDIPPGYVVQLHPRSGLSYYKGLTLTNCEGQIDADYVEQVYVSLMNVTNVAVKIDHGDRVAQFELVKNLDYKIDYIKTKPKHKTSRKGGFGSTGK